MNRKRRLAHKGCIMISKKELPTDIQLCKGKSPFYSFEVWIWEVEGVLPQRKLRKSQRTSGGGYQNQQWVDDLPNVGGTEPETQPLLRRLRIYQEWHGCRWCSGEVEQPSKNSLFYARVVHNVLAAPGAIAGKNNQVQNVGFPFSKDRRRSGGLALPRARISWQLSTAKSKE